ncbi:MAG: ABC transporter permease [Roseburia sp.]
MKKKIGSFVISLIIPVLLLCLWQVLAMNGIIKETLMPRPTKIGSTLWKLILNGKLPRDIGISLRRVILGYLLGASVGIIVGIILGLFHRINNAMKLLLEVLRPIPIIAWVPILILWVGIDEESKIIVIAIGTFWPVLLNVVSGIKSVDKKYLEVSTIFMKSKVTTITKVVLPAAMPSIFTGLRIASGNALMGVIGAEMFAASAGLGYMISYAREMSQPAKMLGGVFVIGVLGYLLNTVVAAIEKRQKQA